ncbi:MAG: GntR family transcriptional regulator [Planctomycetes bacterium]|nr:GntR family transcriptional regulator [Planctomycetota bacterium]
MLAFPPARNSMDHDMIAVRPAPLVKTTVSASAAKYLRSEIIGGGIRAGDSLPEARIGELLGVSRVPVREALVILEREGLVTFDRRGTARVRTFTLEDVRELGVMRLVLEPMAARLAANRGDATALGEIARNLTNLKRARTLSDITGLDFEYHRLIMAAAGNSRLSASWENLASQLRVVMRLFHQAWERKTLAVRINTVKAHAALFDAISRGDGAGAESIAREQAEGWLVELGESGAFDSPVEARE